MTSLPITLGTKQADYMKEVVAWLCLQHLMAGCRPSVCPSRGLARVLSSPVQILQIVQGERSHAQRAEYALLPNSGCYLMLS